MSGIADDMSSQRTAVVHHQMHHVTLIVDFLRFAYMLMDGTNTAPDDTCFSKKLRPLYNLNRTPLISFTTILLQIAPIHKITKTAQNSKPSRICSLSPNVLTTQS